MLYSLFWSYSLFTFWYFWSVFVFWKDIYFWRFFYSSVRYISGACFVSLTFVFRCLYFFYRCSYSACLRTRVKRLLWASRWVFIIYIGITSPPFLQLSKSTHSLLCVHAGWINWIEIYKLYLPGDPCFLDCVHACWIN